MSEVGYAVLQNDGGGPLFFVGITAFAWKE